MKRTHSKPILASGFRTPSEKQVLETMKLKKGRKYNLKNWRVIGWAGPDGPLYPEGYHYLYYFNKGVYLGPDMYGVEPLFEKV